MKIIIIEDEAAAYKNIKNLLLQIDPHIEILDHFDTVVDSVTWLRSHPMPDLIFMDIQLIRPRARRQRNTHQYRKPIKQEAP